MLTLSLVGSVMLESWPSSLSLPERKGARISSMLVIARKESFFQHRRRRLADQRRDTFNVGTLACTVETEGQHAGFYEASRVKLPPPSPVVAFAVYIS